MKTRLLVPLLMIAAGFLGACQSSPYSQSKASGENDIDGISRDISRNEGGSIHDPMTPPPVRPSYVQDR